MKFRIFYEDILVRGKPWGVGEGLRFACRVFYVELCDDLRSGEGIEIDEGF